MTKQDQNQQPQVQPQEQQGTGVDMKFLLESYMQQTLSLTKENMMLKAYIAQLQSEKATKNSGTPNDVKGQPAN